MDYAKQIAEAEQASNRATSKHVPETNFGNIEQAMQRDCDGAQHAKGENP